MHEKTLLYGALAFTAVAAGVGVWHGTTKHEDRGSLEISPLPRNEERRLPVAEVPIRLTASDGTGLKLVALKASAAVEDPLALTEIHLTFENPENRVLEGTFRITLPQGASLSRFAMKVGTRWQEGEVVEKQAARRAYEDFLHRKQDPALMEQGGGNEFSARVFPIPARGQKEIVLAYSEVIEAGAPYTLPLRGLPNLGALDVDVRALGGRAGSDGKTDLGYGLHQTKVTPAADFVVEGKRLPRSQGLRAGDLVIARVVPFADSRPAPLDSAVILVDTSASRGLGIDEQARLVAQVVARLPKSAKIEVACFDQEVVSIYRGSAGEFGDNETKAIIDRGALGASDFEGALAWAGDAAKKNGAKRVVLVGDGVATAGETDGQKLKLKIERLRDAGVERIDAVAVGGIRDDGFLRTAVRSVLDKDGVVLDAKLGPDAIARRLSEATTSGIPVTVEGAEWSWPRTLDGLQAGDEVMVYAKVARDRPLRISVDKQPFAPDVRTTDRPLVERAWAQAKMQSLIEAPTMDAASTQREVVALSTRYRVVSPYTALLVLETDADYQRFGIDRNATVDILSVRDGRVAVYKDARDRDDRLEDAKEQKKAKGRDLDESAAAAPAAAAPAAAAPAAAAPPVGRAVAPAPAAQGAAEDEGAPGGVPGGVVGGVTGSAVGIGNGAIGGRGGGAAAADPRAESDAPTDLAASAHDHRPSEHERGAPMASAAPMATTTGAPPVAPPRPITRLDDGRPGANDGLRVDPSEPWAAGGETTPAPQRTREAPPRQAQSGAFENPVRSPGGTLQSQEISADGLAQSDVQTAVRRATPRLRACYNQALQATPSLAGGRMIARVVVDKSGQVKSAAFTDLPAGVPASMNACMTATFKGMTFTAPGVEASFAAGFQLVPGANAASPPDENVANNAAYEGRFKIVMDDLSRGDKDGARDEAKRWHVDQPGDIMAFVALGEAMEARGDVRTAARAYGSILELFSFRADSRRFAGERLERLKDQAALRLAADSYAKAVVERPDHPASHRLYAYTLLKLGDYEKAFDAIKAGAARSYPVGRFRGVDRILKEDMGLVAAAWTAAQPGREAEIRQKLLSGGGIEEHGPSLRFVLVWETDANDVDFHIKDAKGGHAYYSTPTLPSGGELYADVTTGYGPECFTIRNPEARRAYPYTLQAHYFSRGPMGYGMGKLEIIDHDGHGKLTFDERPFVVMKDRAFVDLGTVAKP